MSHSVITIKRPAPVKVIVNPIPVRIRRNVFQENQMAVLPTTNLSLNAIHVEIGGSSGTQVSLNDADVRGIGTPSATYAPSGISQTSESTISMGLFRGAEDVVLVNLSGTASSPNVLATGSAIGAGVTATSVMKFETNGDLLENGNNQPNTAEWYDGTPSTTWYLRVLVWSSSQQPTTSGGSTSNNGSFNTWLPLTSQRLFFVSATNATTNGATAGRTTTFRAEIAKNSDGSQVVATGFYRCQASAFSSF